MESYGSELITYSANHKFVKELNEEGEGTGLVLRINLCILAKIKLMHT